MKSILIVIFSFAFLVACDDRAPVSESSSGAKRVTVKIPKGPDGTTIEQRNVADRLLLDNKPGSIKHLYVISAYSGQAIIYSTVKGKVTSSGKRLTPNSVIGHDGLVGTNANYVRVGNRKHTTHEVMQDDGTYGSSVHYLFWWDAQGRYHQHYVSGGQILHISDQPLAIKGVVINMELKK